MTYPKQTTPPGKYVVLFDGLCKLCTAGSKKLLGLAKPGAVEAVNFQDVGALDRFPGLTHDECMKAMFLVTPEGRVFQGFEAAVRAVASRAWLRPIAYL